MPASTLTAKTQTGSGIHMLLLLGPKKHRIGPNPIQSNNRLIMACDRLSQMQDKLDNTIKNVKKI